jgi:DNA polymerase II
MTSTTNLRGWVLSIYPDNNDGAVVWLLGEDGVRYRLKQAFQTTFYIEGERSRLRNIADALKTSKPPVLSKLTTRQHLYRGELEVLAVIVNNPVYQQKIFYWLQRSFKQIRYFDAKIPFSIRYSATMGIFPMAHCQVDISAGNTIINIKALDNPWSLDYNFPPFRTLRIFPNQSPRHALPTRITIHHGDTDVVKEIKVTQQASFLQAMQKEINTFDPDVILAAYGDGWLFPHLVKIAKKHNILFNPSRDPNQHYQQRQARTFESYGSIYHRDEQTRLFGRWHIDPKNSTMGMGFDFNMHSAIELARVTGVDAQTAARNSPGSGFTAIQIREAVSRKVLVPLHKRQTEKLKSAMQLHLADNGGLNYRPVVGLHANVAELDFFSMYPSIMSNWNISGETVGTEGKHTLPMPDTNTPINQDSIGLVPAVLAPLLDKRLKIKKRIRLLDKNDEERKVLQSMADALKWLGYVSFGYQGYKNNLFGNIQAHEAICAIGRESLVSAIEVAHEHNFDVLAANVDSIFVRKDGAKQPEDFEEVMAAINQKTGLVIELEGIFNWIAFTRAKTNPRIGAANRYFGRFLDGSVKVRGLAQRRRDTPEWIKDIEKETISTLANIEEAALLADAIPGIIRSLQMHMQALTDELVPIESLVSKTKLSREISQYRGNSLSAKAAKQLKEAGKEVKVGQTVPFIYTQGAKSAIMAWDIPTKPSYAKINKIRYKELLLRAIHQVIQPLGLEAEGFQNLVYEELRQLPLWTDESLDYQAFEEEISLADMLFFGVEGGKVI